MRSYRHGDAILCSDDGPPTDEDLRAVDQFAAMLRQRAEVQVSSTVSTSLVEDLAIVTIWAHNATERMLAVEVIKLRPADMIAPEIGRRITDAQWRVGNWARLLMKWQHAR